MPIENPNQEDSNTPDELRSDYEGLSDIDEFGPDLTVCNVLNDVRHFHQRINGKISETPTLLSTDSAKCNTIRESLNRLLAEIRNTIDDSDELLCRLCLSLEETVEWLDSHLNQDLIAAGDAIGDRMYVLIGDAVASGMPLHRIFEEIHQSNMSKSECIEGDLGKADKSDDYFKPNLGFLND